MGNDINDNDDDTDNDDQRLPSTCTYSDIINIGLPNVREGECKKKKKKLMIFRLINKIAPLMILAIALTACSGSEDTSPASEPEYYDDMPVSFLSSVGTPITRADQLLWDNGYSNFGIWTWKSQDGGSTWLDVMKHYRVIHDTKYIGDGRGENGWGYDLESGQVLKYWDLSCRQYDFKGYAPFCPNGLGSDPYISMQANNKLTFHNISGHFAAKDAVTEYSDTYKDKIDWVYCYGKRTLSPLPVSPAKFDRDMTIATPEDSYLGNALTRTNPVPLRFHHLLPKVIFQIHLYNPDDLDMVITPEIGVSIMADLPTTVGTVGYEKIDPSTHPSSGVEFVDPTIMHPTLTSIPKWIFSAPTLVPFSRTAGTHYQDLSPYDDDGHGNITKQGWMELPQNAPSFNVKLKVDGETFVRTLTPGVDGMPSTWEPDHIYIYIIQFNYKTKRMEATSYMEEWTSKDGGEFNLPDW